MSPYDYCRDHVAGQQNGADAALLKNVRERGEGAANAWSAVATSSQRRDGARSGVAEGLPVGRGEASDHILITPDHGEGG